MKKEATAKTFEKKTNEFLQALEAKKAPLIYTLTPNEARDVLESVQAGENFSSRVDIEDFCIDGPIGKIPFRIIRPKNKPAILPIIFYCHGAGWVMGSAKTHERLTVELVEGTGAALCFIDYTRSPEAKFPQALEELYAGVKYLLEKGQMHRLDPKNMVVAGDSVGGNLAIGLTTLAKARKEFSFKGQALFYPVTDSSLSTASYQQFAEGPWLTKKAMEWFWDAYEPDCKKRTETLESPIQIPIEHLKGLPPALVLTAEYDVLRDEGEAYAHHLMEAGIPVEAMRFLGTTHDFMMLNSMAKNPQTLRAIATACDFMRKILTKSA